MGVKGCDKIWHNGEFIPWESATIHVMSHVVHYGSSLFEGIRCYKTRRGAEVFRLDGHIDRLLNSCKTYRIELRYSKADLMDACVETIRVNRMEACYLRPVVLRGHGDFGVSPFNCPIETYIAIWEWGRYLGPEAVENGVDVCVSSWNRPAPNTFPAMAKAGANYMNAQLIRMEASINGYSEGIGLDRSGFVSEGSGENIFVVWKGELYTPPLFSSILPGITRDSIMRIATNLGFAVHEHVIPREMLYQADEVFFVGTAVEVTPVRSVDRIPVGKGARGPVTAQIQSEFFAYVDGTRDDVHGWFTPVASKKRQEPTKETVRI